jgi:hypothetical protein
MKKCIISYIFCILVTFILAGCSGISISFNPDSKSTGKDVRQNQNAEDKSNIDDKSTQKEDEQDQKSDSADKTPQKESKDSKSSDDKSNVTVNITNDTPQNHNEKDVIVIRDPIPTNIAHGSFIFPNSNCAYLSQNQVSRLTNFELGIARNEIYARHGYIFSLEQFRSYFNAQSWYRPITTNVTLNNIEDYNVQLIKAEEDRRGIKWS